MFRKDSNHPLTPLLYKEGEHVNRHFRKRNKVWFVLIFFVSIFFLSRYKPADQPLHGDNALLMYMQYMLSYGEPLYQKTVFDYPPISAMVGAAGMSIGKLFAAPFYLSSRYLCIIIVSLTASFMFLILQKVTGNHWVGVFAGIAMFSMKLLGILACTNLDPKVLLSFFMVLSCFGIVYDKWWLASMSGILAGFCWQPAILVPTAALIILLFHLNAARLRSFALGVVLGLLVPGIFFIVNGGFKEFFLQAVVNQALQSGGRSAYHPFGWATSIWRLLSDERFFALMAGIGLVWFILQSARNGIRSMIREWFNPAYAGIPVLTIFWIGFSSIHFQGWNDVSPFFPLVAFWSSLAIARILAVKKYSAYLPLFILPLALIYGVFDVFQYSQKYYLNEELAIVQSTVKELPASKKMIVIGADEFYMFTDSMSPWKYHRLDRHQDNFVSWYEKTGCESVIEKFHAQSPGLVILRMVNPSSCLKRIESEILSTEFLKSSLYVPGPRRPFTLDVYVKRET